MRFNSVVLSLVASVTSALAEEVDIVGVKGWSLQPFLVGCGAITHSTNERSDDPSNDTIVINLRFDGTAFVVINFCQAQLSQQESVIEVANGESVLPIPILRRGGKGSDVLLGKYTIEDLHWLDPNPDSGGEITFRTHESGIEATFDFSRFGDVIPELQTCAFRARRN